MIETLTGSNTFGWQSALRQRVQAYIEKYGDFGLERLDGEEAGIERISEALQSLPFLAEKKLVVLRNPGAQKKFQEDFESILKTVPEQNDVLLVEPRVDRRTSYYKTLKKLTLFQEYPDLDGPGLSDWLVQTAAASGGQLSRADATYLVERVGPNQQLLHYELQKLLDYDSLITRAAIELLSDRTPQSTTFELLDAALAGRTKQAMELYAEQRAMKVEPQAIIGLLAWQLHALAVVQAAGQRDPYEVAKEAKLNPFVVRKSQPIASRLGRAGIQRLVRDLKNLDIKLKTSAADADEALQLFLIQMNQES